MVSKAQRQYREAFLGIFSPTSEAPRRTHRRRKKVKVVEMVGSPIGHKLAVDAYRKVA